MLQNYYDGMAICRQYRPPDFFITVTCNPKWPEIAEGLLEAGQRPIDRNDIVVRVFSMKLEDLLHDIKKKGDVFGPCCAGTCLVHFWLLLPLRFRLPTHVGPCAVYNDPILSLTSHMDFPSCLVLHTVDMIDSFMSVEIPDPSTDPLGYALVAEHMVHGPCGSSNPNCPCMKKGVFSKYYPKPYHKETSVDAAGFAVPTS